MKTVHSIILTAAALFALNTSVLANFYTDTNTHNVDLSEGQSVTGTWSYGPIGSGESITKIETWFKFSSGDQEYEQVHIDLGIGDGPIDVSWTSGSFNFGSNYTVDWTFTNNASLFDDASNGSLSYKVSAPDNHSYVNNDFTFNWAKIEVTTASHSVPDSSATIALLGLGMFAIAGVQRKLRLAR